MAAATLLAVGGCGDTAEGGASGADKGEAGAAVAKPPKKLVEWAGGMCEASVALAAARKESRTGLKEVRAADSIGAEGRAVSYVSRAEWPLEKAQSAMEAVSPSGVAAADRLQKAWVKKLKGITEDLDEFSPLDAADAPVKWAKKTDGLVQSSTAPEPGLAGLRKKDARIAAAHKRAEQCAPGWKPEEEGQKGAPSPDPTGPLPEAKDGENTDACEDGKCEIRVSSQVSVTANGLRLQITHSEGGVTFVSSGSVMQLGGGSGVAGFGDDLKVTVVAHNEDGAVLKFEIP